MSELVLRMAHLALLVDLYVHLSGKSTSPVHINTTQINLPPSYLLNSVMH